MSLSDLTKDQKKYIGMGLVGAIVVVVLAVMGIQFSLSSITTAKLELADLTSKIENADEALAKRDQAREDYDHTVTLLKEYFAGVPPEKNYYAWATELIYSTGRDAGLEIDSVDEVANNVKAKTEEAAIKLASYTVRITAHGSYEQVKLFLQNIEETHSLVRITGLEIGIGTKLSSHNVQVYIQWPFNLDEITAVWDEIASKQRKIAIREVTQPAPERNKAQAGNELDEPATKPAAAPVDPEPVLTPEPQPTPVPDVVTPVPVVTEPEPFVRLKPVPEPEIAKSEPVVAAVVPEPEPIVKPRPEPVPEVERPESLLATIEDTKPEPEVNTSEARTTIVIPVEPEPVVTAAVPEPEPSVVKSTPEPDPVAEGLESLLASLEMPETGSEVIVTNSPKTVSSPEETAPVVAAVIPDPVVVEPALEVESIDSLLSSYAHLETGAEVRKLEPQTKLITVVETAPEPVEPKDEFGSLLASLDSHNDEAQESVSADTASSDPEALEDFLKKMSEAKPLNEDVAVENAEVEEPVIPEPVIQPAASETVHYISTEKSAKILQELLSKEEPKAGASLSSFLDSLVEDINE